MQLGPCPKVGTYDRLAVGCQLILPVALALLRLLQRILLVVLDLAVTALLVCIARG